MGNRRLIAWALAVALGGALLTAAPAQASTTILCVGYDSCARKGYDDHGYKEKRFNLFWRMAGDHNCTNYVASILVAKGMPNVRPWVGDGNAYAWGDFNATDRTPVKGAIAWWDSNQPPVSSSGHVAYVERVISSSEIIVSEDNWKGEFRWKRITKSSGWPTGFIHLKDSRTPAKPAFDATKVSQSVWTDSTKTTSVSSASMAPGSTAWVELRYLNSGSTAWTGATLAPVGPVGRTSAIVPNPVSATSVAVQSPATVAPGKVAKFGFEVKIPADAAVPTTWSEHFAPRSSRGAIAPNGDAWLLFGAQAGTDFEQRPQPVVTGVRKEGETLVATPGTWPADATLAFSWRRDDTVISSAPTYKPTATDVGARLTVTVTAAAPGRLPSSQTSPRTAPIASVEPAILNRGESLYPGDKLVSPNGRFELIQRADGNLVIYDRFGGIPVWANTAAGSKLHSKLTTGGVLVTYSPTGSHEWTSGTRSKGVVNAALRNDGKLVLRNSSRTIVWSSYTSGR